MSDDTDWQLRRQAYDALSTTIDAELLTPASDTSDSSAGPDRPTRHLTYDTPAGEPLVIVVAAVLGGSKEDACFDVCWRGGGGYDEVTLWRPSGPQQSAPVPPDGEVCFNALARGPIRLVATLSGAAAAVQTEWFLLSD